MMQQIITQDIVNNDDEMFIRRYQQENPWGLATSVDLYDCNPDAIHSAEKIRAFVDALCSLINMKKFGPTVVVDFGEDPRVSGYSMTQLIETSLISGHFANQSNAAYIDIFSILFLTLISLWKRHRQVVGQPATSLPSSREHTKGLSLANLAAIARVWKPLSPVAAGLLLAVTAGIIENAAVLTFSFDTRIATTGITSAIASSYALVVMMFGMIAYHERLTKNQLMGIGMFTTGLILLAL